MGAKGSESIRRTSTAKRGVGITGKQKMHPTLHRILTGRESTLLDLASILGK
jgi:hypothetical protein